MDSRSHKLVAVSGYGSTGSSPLIDLLREFDGYVPAKQEFRLIKDPYGILFLENGLVDNWDVLPSDIAIKDFLWLAEQWNRVPTKLSLPGMHYERIVGSDFMSLTREYVNKLVSFPYEAHWFFLDMRVSWPHTMWHKLRRKLNLGKNHDMRNTSQTMYFSRPSHEEFLEHTRWYLAQVFGRLAAANDAATLILNQAVPAPNPRRAMDYLGNAKVIIVDRDPRDTFVDLINRRLLIGRTLSEDGGVLRYITWHRAQHEGARELDDPRVLKLRFEQLALDYDATVTRVLDFLGEDPEVHIRKHQFLDPAVARQKVGLWRDYHRQDDIAGIYRELREYCF